MVAPNFLDSFTTFTKDKWFLNKAELTEYLYPCNCELKIKSQDEGFKSLPWSIYGAGYVGYIASKLKKFV